MVRSRMTRPYEHTILRVCLDALTQCGLGESGMRALLIHHVREIPVDRHTKPITRHAAVSEMRKMWRAWLLHPRDPLHARAASSVGRVN
jgi:hypothetical protein